MYLVTLEDSTVYAIDTESEFNAREVVRYKLKDRLDFRNIESVEFIEGVIMDKSSKNYNSGNQFDGKDLKCIKGWSYRWR